MTPREQKLEAALEKILAYKPDMYASEIDFKRVIDIAREALAEPECGGCHCEGGCVGHKTTGYLCKKCSTGPIMSSVQRELDKPTQECPCEGKCERCHGIPATVPRGSLPPDDGATQECDCPKILPDVIHRGCLVHGEPTQEPKGILPNCCKKCKPEKSAAVCSYCECHIPKPTQAYGIDREKMENLKNLYKEGTPQSQVFQLLATCLVPMERDYLCHECYTEAML